jgi:hypothetical protein
LADAERGRLFFVKRTAGHVVPAGFLQRHAFVYNFDDVDSGYDSPTENLET